MSAVGVRTALQYNAQPYDSTTFGTVNGRVLDESGAPLSNVNIQLNPGDLQRTSDSKGTFAYDSLSPGRYFLVAKTIGRAAVTLEITVTSRKTSTIVVQFGLVQRLDTVVTLDANKSKDRIEYEQRRAAHLGYALEGQKLAERADSFSALSTFPGVQLSRKGFGVVAKMGASRCSPTVFLDGMKTDIELASSLPVDHLRAIEVFTHPLDAPPVYHLQAGCAIIMFWSTRHKW